MALERLRIYIDAVAAGAVRDLEKVGATATKVGLQTDAMNAQTKTASSGFAGMSNIALGAAGAIVVGGVAAFKAAGEYADLANEVRRFRDITGVSTDTASRWIAVLDDYDIPSAKATRGMQTLAQATSDGGAKLRQYGVDVVYAKDGSVDLQGTVENVADAFSKSHSPTEKQGLLIDAFGKKVGSELIPILEGGRRGIRDMFAEVPKGQILDDKDLDRARQFQLAMDDLQDVFKELVILVGGLAAGPLTAVAQALSMISRGAIELNDQTDGVFMNLVTGGTDAVGAAGKTVDMHGILIQELGNVRVGTQRYKEIVRELKDEQEQQTQKTSAEVEGQKRLAEEMKSSTDKANALKMAIDTLMNQALGFLGATLNTQQAVSAEADARVKLTEAIQQHGASSAEAAAAQRQLEQAQLGVTQATVNQDAQFDKLVESVRTGDASFADVIAKLEREKQLHPEAAAAIQAQIDKLNWLKAAADALPPGKSIPVDADMAGWVTGTARLRTDLDNIGRSGAAPGIGAGFGWTRRYFAEGGLVDAPKGTAVPATLHGQEFVLDAGTTERIRRGAPTAGSGAGVSSGVAGGGLTVQVCAETIFGRDVPAVVAEGLAEAARTGQLQGLVLTGVTVK